MAVPVPCMPPAPGGMAVPPRDRERPFDRLAQAVGRDDDVFADLTAASRGHGDGDAVAPAPDARDLRRLRRRVHGESAFAENLDEICAQAFGLLLGAVRLGDDEEGRAAGPLTGEGGTRRLE